MMRAISQALKLNPSKILKGIDIHGNKYYEVPPQKYYFWQREVVKLKRVVEPPDAEEIMIERDVLNPGKDLPIEWVAWLQWRRDDAPSMTEVEKNIARRDLMKKKVERLMEKDKVESGPPVKKPEKLEQAEVDSWKP